MSEHFAVDRKALLLILICALCCGVAMGLLFGWIAFGVGVVCGALGGTAHTVLVRLVRRA